MARPVAPAGIGVEGRRLWRSVLDEYELGEHELVLLRRAVRVADACGSLQAVIDVEGVMAGDHPHPALVELRQQSITLARLIVALRIPAADDAGGDAKPRSQRRGTRGVYLMDGAS
jgi:hypothetical protein